MFKAGDLKAAPNFEDRKAEDKIMPMTPTVIIKANEGTEGCSGQGITWLLWSCWNGINFSLHQ